MSSCFCPSESGTPCMNLAVDSPTTNLLTLGILHETEMKINLTALPRVEPSGARQGTRKKASPLLSAPAYFFLINTCKGRGSLARFEDSPWFGSFCSFLLGWWEAESATRMREMGDVSRRSWKWHWGLGHHFQQDPSLSEGRCFRVTAFRLRS